MTGQVSGQISPWTLAFWSIK